MCCMVYLSSHVWERFSNTHLKFHCIHLYDSHLYVYSGIVYICIRVCTNVHVYVMYAMPAICIIDYSILILWVYILYTGSLLCEN